MVVKSWRCNPLATRRRLLHATPVRCTFRILLTVVCGLYLSGAHWTVLQLTAWSSMLVVRAEQEGLAKAVQSTFSGEAPCRLCHAIKDGRKNEQQREPESLALKKVFELQGLALVQESWVLRRESTEVVWPELAVALRERTDAPLTPPPLV